MEKVEIEEESMDSSHLKCPTFVKERNPATKILAAAIFLLVLLLVLSFDAYILHTKMAEIQTEINQLKSSQNHPHQSAKKKFQDCSEIPNALGNQIIVIKEKEVEVHCMPDGWTVIQSRGQFGNPGDYFLRGWDSYVKGFGVPGKEHWLGLNNIHDLTQSKDYQLRITMRNFDRQNRTAFYDHFYLNDRSKYQLSLGKYSGNAGDSLTYQNGALFSTIDKDQDTYKNNCAVEFKGAWWYKDCHSSNLNGFNFGTGEATPYAQGIVWKNFTSHHRSLWSVQMSVKPISA